MPLHLIHTADWHLGQTFFGYDREAEHDAFLEWLGDTLTQRQTDVLLIAGDIFDVANPSATAQRRFYRFLRETSRRNPGLQIVVIAGNHDSAVRLEAPVPLLEEMNTALVGLVKRKEEGGIDFDSLVFPLCDREGNRKAWCLAVPFLRQGDYPASEEEQDTYIAGIGRMYAQLVASASQRRVSGEALVAMGHLHATGAELSDDDRSERVIMGGLESVPVDAFSAELAYTALGHIHKAQRVGGRENVRYAGSPLPMSFSEKNYRHQVVEVVLEGEEVVSVASVDIPLTAPLMRVPEQPASPAEVLERVASLPDAGADDASDTSRWPYLEVRVLLSEPDPGFRHRVEEVLEGKAVRLTSIVPSYPQRQGEEAGSALADRDLRKIDPTDMVRQAFAAKYGCELPAEMEELFNEVMREVSL